MSLLRYVFDPNRPMRWWDAFWLIPLGLAYVSLITVGLVAFCFSFLGENLVAMGGWVAAAFIWIAVLVWRERRQTPSQKSRK